MSYLCQTCQTIGVTDFISGIEGVENYPDFEKFTHVIRHGLQVFTAKILKVSQRKQNAASFLKNFLYA